MTWRAPAYVREDSTTTPTMQYTIDASNDWFTQNAGKDLIADLIVQHYSSQVSQFVNNNRQQYSLLGGDGPRRTQTSNDGIGVDHIFNGPQETIRITVKPEFFNLGNLPLLLDLNFDGYCALVHNWEKLPPPGVDNAAIDFVVNGFGILTNYTPDDDLLQIYQPALEPDPPAAEVTQATIIVIAAFGPTALRCQSQQDASKKNTFVLQKASGGPLPPLVPGRVGIPAAGDVPKHPDLLGYFVFNWGDQLNPDAWAYNGSQGSGPDFTYDANFPPATIVKIIQFKDASKSPLNINGPNSMYAQYTNTPAVGTGQNGVDFLCAEFFDRNALRAVVQSWTYSIGVAEAILVNDKPLYFAVDGGSPFSDIGAKTNFGLDWDLTSQQNVPDAATLGNASTTTRTPTPISGEQQAVIDANAAAASIHGAAFSAALTALTAAQEALATANANIYVPTRGSEWTLANAVARNPGPATAADMADLVALVGELGAQELVAYLTAELKFQANPTSTNATAFENSFSTMDPSLQTLMEGDLIGVFADQSAVNYSTAYPIAYNAAIAAGNTVAQAQTAGANALSAALSSLNTDEASLVAYATTIGHTPLGVIAAAAKTALVTAQNAFIPLQQDVVPETIKSGGFQPLDAFSFRTITVSGGLWTFGSYS